jgi:sigma-B regulation protein RsbU (phosphoserine phosphatase)
MNHLLLQMNMGKVNVAMLYAVIQRQPDGSLVFNVSNGGIISPLLLRPAQSDEYIDACGLPLGVLKDPSYYECQFHLSPGDLIILSSDGIVEAVNERGEMFGFERLEQFAANCSANLSAEEIVARLKGEVSTFVGSTAQHDDITVVAVRVV